MAQVTWIKILGMATRNVIVDGKYISRRLAPDEYQVLHVCDSHKQALAVLEAWHREVYLREAEALI